MLLAVATELTVPLYEWSVTTGLAKYRGAPIYNSEQPEQALVNIPLLPGDAIFWLKDFARYCDNDKICRRLRDLAEKFRTVRRAIVLSAPSLQLPAELSGEAAPFQLSLPTADELLPAVKSVLGEVYRDQRIPVALDFGAMAQIARNLAGLSETEATRAPMPDCWTTSSTQSASRCVAQACLKPYVATRRLPTSLGWPDCANGSPNAKAR
jgi:hypothetical protein